MAEFFGYILGRLIVLLVVGGAFVLVNRVDDKWFAMAVGAAAIGVLYRLAGARFPDA